ncbi:MAG: protein kinase [Isosphaeraceae bacterium]|nr:protein kinase [Isosphaeraceae bacterium]
MRVILDIVYGPRAGQLFVFDHHDTFIVGRSSSVHCPMPTDNALSRDHFMIEVQPPLCELRDLGSTNGTFVNDRKVDRIRLKTGDRISAGQSVFLVRIEESSTDSDVVVDRSRPNNTIYLNTKAEPIVCENCGTHAPSGTEASVVDGWLCDLCSGEVENSPQPVPQYTVLRELGKGGMGVVYQARDNTSGRMVALKLIVPENAASRTAIDRFLREMSVISQLKHPNIVEWLEQGMTRGQFWFAMEFVSGTNLEAIANAEPGRYPINQACRMACQVLKGLEHAHNLGFVHRDIKPENILIAQTQQGLIAKISDFGLAKSFRGLGLSGLTFSGEMRGTIPFMPPEQMLDFRTVLPSADLYSTAATLYYLISGQFIYDQQGDNVDPIKMLLEDRPVPIQERRADVPGGLAAVLQKGLAREPADRYPDATSLRRALRPYC